MDKRHFEALTRSLDDALSRRCLGRLAGTLLAALGSLQTVAGPATARKKKRRKKKKRGGSSPSGPSGPRPGETLATYDVTLEGIVDGRSFQRSGVLRLVQPFSSSGTQNGANAVDVCLSSGNPYSSPSVGAITLGSNSACFGGTAQVDVASISKPNAQQILLEPDPNLAAICINVYNNASGLTAPVYAPYNGGMLIELRSSGQTVVGAIDTNGLGNCITPVGSRYQAQFSGQRR